MATIQVGGFFCEDIREEKSGQDTIVGILPDNMFVATFPSVTPRVGIYLRVHFNPLKPPKKITAKFTAPWGESFAIGLAEKEIIDVAVAQAKERSLPLTGVILKAMMVPFKMQQAGLALATVSVDGGKDVVCAMLNLIEGTTAASSTEQQQP